MTKFLSEGKTLDILSKILWQNLIFFSILGTIRFNLDPNGDINDEQLWKALEHAHLKKHIKDNCEGKLFVSGQTQSWVNGDLE